MKKFVDKLLRFMRNSVFKKAQLPIYVLFSVFWTPIYNMLTIEGTQGDFFYSWTLIISKILIETYLLYFGSKYFYLL